MAFFAALRMTLWLCLAPLPAAGQSAHIADNSFLVEEAYNQEAGVVQHISTFSRGEGGEAWDFGFTQEWPLRGMQHQLSYTVPVLHADGSGTGLGDVLLNYRYQLVGDGEIPLHVAPRFSIVLPTGSEDEGRGSGSVGLQAALPVSYVLNDALATHGNAGLELDGESGEVDARLGASAIWRVHRSVNLMLETVWESFQDEVVLLNPGVRWAFDLAGGLQIVPGVAYTFALGAGQADALFLYLSFEHPFRRD
ncbi:MAG: transporter [Gemmatimonadales bacterium]|nr:transporter [Gemmatimonadales bacterium]